MKSKTAVLLGALSLVVFFILVISTGSPISVVLLVISIILFVIGTKGGESKATAKPEHKPKTRSQRTASNLAIRTTQFNETLDILRTTTNCDTFLGRMDFAFKISYETGSQNWLNFLNDNAVLLTQSFIVRSINNERTAIENLKTDNGKKNRFNKYRDTMLTAFQSCSAAYARDNIDFLSLKLDALYVLLFPEIKLSFSESPAASGERWKDGVSDEVFDRFVKAIFLCSARKGIPLRSSPEGYPQYYKYELNTPRPEKLHRELIDEGMLTLANTRVRLERMTVPELKALLSEYSLPVSGKKAKLVETALSGIAETELNKKLGENNLTMLTEQGESFLSFAEGYAELFRCGWSITLREYEEYRQKGILSFSQAAECILLQRDQKPSFVTKLQLAQLFYNNKEYSRSLAYYIQTMYYETCDYSHDKVFFAPGNAAKIRSLAEYFNDDMIERCYRDNPQMRSSYSKEEFKAAVYKALKGEE
ncbi:MAG: SAP domain-containing protein [Oscillospiraceae bacterium]